MLKTFGSHVRGNVVGYIALFVALGGTTYAATGDNLILGQANSAGTPTQLSSATTGSALRVTNTGSGWAFGAFGNATQGRARGGFVKAMAFVDPIGHPSDPIRQCFNSQLPASEATSGNCGITYASPLDGIFDLNFGFRVDDRFASVTTSGGVAKFATASSAFGTSNAVEVNAWYLGGSFSDTAFYIFVY